MVTRYTPAAFAKMILYRIQLTKNDNLEYVVSKAHAKELAKDMIKYTLDNCGENYYKDVILALKAL